MKRAKIKGHSNEKKQRMKYTKEATDFLTLLMETAVRDVFNATDEQINQWKKTVNLYAQHVVNGVVSLEDFKKVNAKGGKSNETVAKHNKDS